MEIEEILNPLNKYSELLSAIGSLLVAFFAYRGINSWRENEQYKRAVSCYEHAYSNVAQAIELIIDVRIKFKATRVTLESDNKVHFAELLSPHQHVFEQLKISEIRMRMLNDTKAEAIIKKVIEYKKDMSTACELLDLVNSNSTTPEDAKVYQRAYEMFENKLFASSTYYKKDNESATLIKLSKDFLDIVHDNTLFS